MKDDDREFLAAVVEALEYIAENPHKEILDLMQDYPGAPPPGYCWVRRGPGRKRLIPFGSQQGREGGGEGQD